DNERWVSNDRGKYYVNSVDTGAHLSTYVPTTMLDQFLYASPTPTGSAYPYVGIIYRNRQNAVAYLRKDLSAAKLIWKETGSSRVGSNEFVRIDPSGEWVAWSQERGSGSSAYMIALKSVREPVSTPPTLLGALGYASAYFCDFTED